MKRERKGSLFLNVDDDEKPASGVGAGVGGLFVETYFPEARSKIRIATAFFSLRGYKIAEKSFNPNAQIWILVGKREGEHVMEAIVDEAVRDLGQCEELISATVENLKTKLEKRQCVVQDARRLETPYHCKFYACDERLMFHGSANFSHQGLRVNAEQVSRTFSETEIKTFIEWYDEISKNAPDIFQELIDRLEAWLRLARPFDVYLKTLLLLDKHVDFKRGTGASTPTYYQKAVVAQSLSQIQSYGGALVVAATGLGKTVIGAEIAGQSVAQGKTKYTILIAPETVHPNWKNEMGERYLAYEIFNNDVLFRRDSTADHHKISRMLKQLRRADEETLIVVDEAHLFRNELLSQEDKKRDSLVYERLGAAVKAGAKIVLLTATAYGTSVQNFNSLLRLLPPRNENRAPGQQRRAQGRLFERTTAWEADSAEEFADLPIVTVLGLPHVLRMARDKKHVDEETGRIFIELAEKRNYLPRTIELRLERYNLFLFNDLKQTFDNGYFEQADAVPCTYYDEDRTKRFERGLVNSIYETSISSWLSSPRAMQMSLEQNINTPGKDDIKAEAPNGKLFDDFDEAEEEFSDEPGLNGDENQYVSSLCYRSLMLKKQKLRSRILGEILKDLKSITAEADDKFTRLKKIVDEHCLQNSGKVIVYVRRHTTACYLAESLRNRSGGNLRIGCTVEACEARPKLAPAHRRAELRKNFSPKSHSDKTAFELDVLICTDADGIGVNLQDADTIVNYDLPDSADVLFQRVGRVLRMTEKPERSIHIYTFAPSTGNVAEKQSDDDSPVARKIGERFKKLTARHDKNQSVLGSGVLSAEEEIDVSLEKSEIDVADLIEKSHFFKSVAARRAEVRLRHTIALEDNTEAAKKLPQAMLSAKSYDRAAMRFFLLLTHDGKYYPVVYKLPDKPSKKNWMKGQFEESISDYEIFDLLACDEKTDKAPVSVADLERLAHKIIKLWCKRPNRRWSVNRVTKVCGIWLFPQKVSQPSVIANIVKELFADDKQYF